MSTTIPNFNTEKVVTGLDTYVYTIQTTAVHIASVRVQTQPGTGLTVAIKQNSTTVATMTLPAVDQSSPQTSQSLSATINAAASDTVSFVFTSSTAADKGLNSIQALLNVHIGMSN